MGQQSADINEWYEWAVRYRDDSLFFEMENGQQRGWASVDQAQVTELHLIPAFEGLPAVVVSVPAGARPILFRRRVKSIDLQTQQEGDVRTVHCVGYSVMVGGERAAVYTWAFADGSIRVTNHDDVTP